MANTAALNGSQPLLVQLLAEKGLLLPEQMESLRQAQLKHHGSLESILVKTGLVAEEQIAQAYAEYLMAPLYDAGPQGADPKLAGLLPEKLCRDHLLAPVASSEDTLDVAFAGFDDMLMVDELQLLTGMYVRPLIARLSVIEAAIAGLYCGSEARRNSSPGRATSPSPQRRRRWESTGNTTRIS